VIFLIKIATSVLGALILLTSPHRRFCLVHWDNSPPPFRNRPAPRETVALAPPTQRTHLRLHLSAPTPLRSLLNVQAQPTAHCHLTPPPPNAVWQCSAVCLPFSILLSKAVISQNLSHLATKVQWIYEI